MRNSARYRYSPLEISMLADIQMAIDCLTHLVLDLPQDLGRG